MAVPTGSRAAAAARRRATVRNGLARVAFPVRHSWGRLTARRRALPDFVVLGAQKAGTSSLYARLCAHPSVAGALRKEVHHFDRPPGALDAYRAFFPTRAHLDHLRRTTGAGLTGEATPFLLCHPGAPARLRAAVPEARLVALLREPAARAVSGYHHAVRHGDEDRPIDVALDPALDEPVAPDDDLAWWDGPCSARRRGYLVRGRYAEQLARWFAHFPREQILVLDPVTLSGGDGWTRVAAFLDLPELPVPAVADRNVGHYRPDATPAVEQRLRTWFAPHNERLWDLLGEDWGWPA